MVMDKYSHYHKNDSNRVINSNINKSGQNITANFTRVAKKGVPQTQRNGTSQGDRTLGRNSTKHSMNP